MGFLQNDLVFFLVAILVIPVFGVRDAARLPADAFQRAGTSKGGWLAAQVLLPVFGTLAYYAFARSRVRASARWGDEE
jgi:hypothetical protein